MKWLKRLLIVSVVLYLGGGAFLYLKQKKFLFHPQKLENDHQYQFDQPFAELELEMGDGSMLNALHFPVENSNGVVIYWHGNGGNIEGAAYMANTFADRNYSTFLCDYREYGKSDGELTEATWWSDSQEVYDVVKTMYAEEDIVLYGWSMGTGVANYLAANNQPYHVILEAPFYSIEELAERMFPIYPIKGLIQFPMLSYEFLPDVKSPVTMFHGTNDRVIPFEHGQRMAALKPLANFIPIIGGGHKSAIFHPEYHSALDRALLGYVREKCEQEKLNKKLVVAAHNL